MTEDVITVPLGELEPGDEVLDFGGGWTVVRVQVGPRMGEHTEASFIATSSREEAPTINVGGSATVPVRIRRRVDDGPPTPDELVQAERELAAFGGELPSPTEDYIDRIVARAVGPSMSYRLRGWPGPRPGA